MADTIASSSNHLMGIAIWCAPSPLFIFVNLVIGTIALVSRFNASQKIQIQKQQQPQQLFQRVKSFNLRHYHNNQPTSVPESESTQPQLVPKPKPSLLQRIVSFKLNKQEPPQPESDENISTDQDQGQDLKPVCDEEKRRVEMMKKSASEKECSMTFDWEEEEDEETVERRRPSTAMARSETTTCKEDEAVDSKADDFINMFKKQLRLQRLDSFIRYRNATM